MADGKAVAQGEDSHMKRTGLLVVPLGVKNAVLVLLRVLSLETSTARAFAAPFRVLSRKTS